jgi:cyclase
MHNKRIIARLDIKNDFVIKGIHLEGLRKVGNPNELAKFYYQEGIDEIIFMDAVASYYDRNSLFHIIKKACENVFIPITVGGGIRNIDDIHSALQSGADKVAINTQAVLDKTFISKASNVFGSQCIVASIVAKKRSAGHWEAYIANGREPTGIDVLEWAKDLQSIGAGEIILTSLDQEGTKRGFDIELCHEVRRVISIPLIISGGAGDLKHLHDLSGSIDVDAIALASMLHYNIKTVPQIKNELAKTNIGVRL